MATYSIAQLEELSGIKSHTIRIWEQRYHLLKPMRTESNIRLYDDDELRKLLNVVLLLNGGFKISKVAEFSDKEINGIIGEKISNAKSDDLVAEALINQLITSGLTFNEFSFEKAFSSAISKFGLKEAYIKVYCPLLFKTGLMWQNDAFLPCQEHFLSNLIKRKFFSILDAMPLNNKASKKWILFLPEGELHEISLLFAAILLREAGHDLIFLGQSVPYDNLKLVVKDYKPTNILFSVVRKYSNTHLKSLLKKMGTDFKKVNIIISGHKNILEGIRHSSNISSMSSVNEFVSILKNNV